MLIIALIVAALFLPVFSLIAFAAWERLTGGDTSFRLDFAEVTVFLVFWFLSTLLPLWLAGFSLPDPVYWASLLHSERQFLLELGSDYETLRLGLLVTVILATSLFMSVAVSYLTSDIYSRFKLYSVLESPFVSPLVPTTRFVGSIVTGLCWLTFAAFVAFNSLDLVRLEDRTVIVTQGYATPQFDWIVISAMILGLLGLFSGKVALGDFRNRVGELKKLACIRRKADRGDPEAQFALGFYYLDPDCKAFSSSKHYNPEAENGLRDAFSWLSKSVKQGWPPAISWLDSGSPWSVWYRERADTEQRAPKANLPIQQGCATNDSNAANLESKSPIDGSSNWLERDVSIVGRLILAAEQGDSSAQFDLGQAYYLGHEGVSKNDAEALKWIGEAASQGHAEAQATIGVAYALGGMGLAKNEVEAVKWARAAALQGHAGGQAALGLSYALGQGGVSKDKVEAAKWLRLSAAQGHPIATDLLRTLDSM